LSGTLKYKEFRKTDQYLLPVRKKPSQQGKYDIYPSFKIGDNKVFEGFESLAERISGYKLVVIDGYSGTFFGSLREKLGSILSNKGFTTHWTDTGEFLKPADIIDEMISPFLGGSDPLFGTRTTLELNDFYIPGRLMSALPDPLSDINFIIGPGASLAGWEGLLIYIDLPKNEIQYRARAAAASNLGCMRPADPKDMYKRYYFVDWVVFNKHKQNILPKINIFVDGQRPDTPVWIEGDDLRDSLYRMSRNLFRARPWFEPGSWGGTWIRDNIPGLNPDTGNYAWSFELISPENGLLIESSSLLCEVSFDCLMYQEAEAVLGDCFNRFGTAFPIRFDFLDTFDGGNLSLQCHPRPDFIREHFREDFTQEETYYILDTKDDAVVFLGFRDNIDPEEFKRDLEISFSENKTFDHKKYISEQNVRKHDLLLIPYGTIHSSGRNNLVLEISSTPYIFTFKMYDWLRPDLDGKPRPLNIDRAFVNLYFDRYGSKVKDKLISKPQLIDSGYDWKLFSMPTHETHFYDVRRYHFNTMIDIATNNKCLVLNLVEGKSIDVQTENGLSGKFSYAETFVIPAAANSVRILNCSGSEAILVIAFVK
jgi:mannose-6-phosphate isomerase class I